MKRDQVKLTPAERKAAERLRKREAGLVLGPEVWVRPEQLPKLALYLKKLAREAELFA
jgi:hypothetical protein